MLSKLFLGLTLVGAEWVLYFLIGVSVLSVALILERFRFYRQASRGLKEFRSQVRGWVTQGQWDHAIRAAQTRTENQRQNPDLESEMTVSLLSHPHPQVEILDEVALDAVIRARIAWDNHLSLLATIGSNTPFVGLFGTVLGIIKAFHELSQQTGTGVQSVTSGISESLVATAIGLLVAIQIGRASCRERVSSPV